MTSKIKQSCAEFAKNPMAGGVEWRIGKRYLGYVYSHESTFSTKFSGIQIDIVPDKYDSGNRFHVFFGGIKMKHKILRNVTAHEAAESAISLCRERVEKMYQEFKQLEV